MKSITRIPFLFAAAMSLSIARADEFSYSYTFADSLNGGVGAGAMVSGTFFGTVSTSNPDLIAGISGVRLSVFGNPVGGGPLYAESQDSSSLAILPDDTATVSFDGLQNNFWFANADTSAGEIATNIFASLDGIDQLAAAALGSNPFENKTFFVGDTTFIQSNWTVTDLGPITALDGGATGVMLGATFAGLAMLRSRFAR
jgi:hypothetical protein